MLNLVDLDERTRRWMGEEWEEDDYVSMRLTTEGQRAFKEAMRRAIEGGDVDSLRREVESFPSPFWKPDRRGVIPSDAGRAPCLTDFNTMYVRGLSRCLLEEGEKHCAVYRAGIAYQPRGECVRVLEGRVFLAQLIYDRHRANYWPEVRRPQVLSVPYGVNCHHSIRRLSGEEAEWVRSSEPVPDAGLLLPL